MTEVNSTETVLFFRNTKRITTILLLAFLLLGVAIRLIDFTDLPLDFAPTRQLHSLIMARGFYYQMDTPETLQIPQDFRNSGIAAGQNELITEPPILENLVAFTYRLFGQENIFIPRAYSIFFWVMGGIPLFLLARKMMSTNGAFAALAFYLFVPFGILASRSFMPDPMVIMSILWALYFLVSWAGSDTLKNAILAGVFTGITILLNVSAAFFVGIPLIGLVLQKGLPNWIKNKRVYLVLGLSILPALIYNIIHTMLGGNAGSAVASAFSPRLFLQIRWYLDWLFMIQTTAGLFPLVIGLLAFFFIKVKGQVVFYTCLWLGYILYSLILANHINTDNYYQLPLVLILALGFGFLFAYIFQKMEVLNKHWFTRLLALLVFVCSIALDVQYSRGVLEETSYRDEAGYWTELGQKVGSQTTVIALTQDHGYRISYWGYVNPSLWPTAADRTVKALDDPSDPAFQQLFTELTLGKSTFLVTMVEEFEEQPDLQSYLLETYPYEQGDDYYIFDLTHPLSAGN